MVISNLGHTKRCNSKCECFNGYSYCPHRVPIDESHHDYLFRMHRTRSDKCFERTRFNEDDTVKSVELIQERGFTVSYGTCSKDEIVTLEKKVKVRKRVRVSAGGVL